MRSAFRSAIRFISRSAFPAGSSTAPWLDIGNGQFLDIGDGQKLGI